MAALRLPVAVDAGTAIAVVLVVFVLAVPFVLALMSPHRGVRSGGRPSHPFRLPTRGATFADPGGHHGSGHVDLPAVDCDDAGDAP